MATRDTSSGGRAAAACDKRPKLSVVLPNYNHARFLPDALDALLAQTMPADEIIVIDDASTDDSLKVIESYRLRFPRFVVISNESNRGVIPNLNAGLRAASGTFLYCAAADDRSHPSLFEQAVGLLETHPQAALFSARCNIISERGEPQGILPTPIPLLVPGFLPVTAVRRKLLDDDGWFVGPSTVWRREYLLNVGGFPENLGAFTDGFVSRQLALMHGACFSPELLSSWRRMEGGYAWEASSIDKAQDLIEQVRRKAEETEGVFPPGYLALWARRYIFGVKRFNLIQMRRHARTVGHVHWIKSCMVEAVLTAWYFATLRAGDAMAVVRRRFLSATIRRGRSAQSAPR